jgi:hypothetical protein
MIFDIFAKQKCKAPKWHVLGAYSWSFAKINREAVYRKTPKAKAAGFRQRKG